MHSLRQRLARDEGFTLIELLVVLIIIGVLLAIAIPSYLGFQKKAQQTAAMSDVRSAIPDAEAYYSDQGNYTAMTAAGLQTTYDSGMQVVGVNGATQGISKAKVGSGGAQTYCIGPSSVATGRTSAARAVRSSTTPPRARTPVRSLTE